MNVNSWTSDPWPIKHQRIAYMQSRGPGCFDHRYYLQKNPDLKVLKTVLELWEHFVMLGQFEGRSYRYLTSFRLDPCKESRNSKYMMCVSKLLSTQALLRYCNVVSPPYDVGYT